MDSVFRTPELMEKILLELPIKDVLLSQRVSSTFKNTITDSPRLQQALFLKPLPGKPLSIRNDEKTAQWAEGPRDRNCFSVIKNPWYHDFAKYYERSNPDRMRNAPERITRPEASWRHMLVSQHPVKVVWLEDADYKINMTHIPKEYQPFSAAGRFHGAPEIDDPANKDGVIQALTFGDIDRITGGVEGDIGMLEIVGLGTWMLGVSLARDVVKHVRPKPRWLFVREDREKDGSSRIMEI